MSGAGAGVMSLLRYISSEVTRSYMLEHDQERYTSKREKMYTFMKIPRELEKFMSYGFFHCLDSFLFVFTFLPLRVLLACLSLIVRLVVAGSWKLEKQINICAGILSLTSVSSPHTGRAGFFIQPRSSMFSSI